MKTSPTEKIFCYVDETGQDTKGDIFIVVAILSGKDKNKLEDFLTKTERSISKNKFKWNKTRLKDRITYLEIVLSSKQINKNIYFQRFKNSREYRDLTALTIAQAINGYVRENNFEKYQATIVIDGLTRTEQFRIAKTIRNLGIHTRKIRGARDESNAIIRSADMIAGMIRDADEGREQFKKIKEKYQNKIREL